MRLIRISALLGLGLLAASVAPSLASAADGFVTATVNERSGPGTDFPPITVIPAGSGITIYGCLSDETWCDVSWATNRGWVSGSYIQATYQSRRVPVTNYITQLAIPFITFNLDSYWDNNYRSRPFYSQRSKWENWHPGNKPPKHISTITKKPPSYTPPKITHTHKPGKKPLFLKKNKKKTSTTYKKTSHPKGSLVKNPKFSKKTTGSKGFTGKGPNKGKSCPGKKYCP